LHDGAARPAENVSDEEYSQGATFLWRFVFDGNMQVNDAGLGFGGLALMKVFRPSFHIPKDGAP